MTILRGRERLTTKINRNFFVRNKGLRIFHLTIFSKKQYFPKLPRKIIFRVRDHFSGNGTSDDKNEYTLFRGKWGTEYGSEIFSSKPPYQLNENQTTSFGGTFSVILVVLLERLFQKKNRVNLCVDPHQPFEFHKNWFKTATCIVTVIIIIS